MKTKNRSGMLLLAALMLISALAAIDSVGSGPEDRNEAKAVFYVG